MTKTYSTAAMAVVVAGAVMASAGAYAQTKPVDGSTRAPRQEMDPSKRVPQASQPTVGHSGATSADQLYRYTPEPVVSERQEQSRGGFFVGVQGGKGWVYRGVDQSAVAINAGYRWQAGDVSLIGIELASGRLSRSTDDGWQYPKVSYGSIGVNARFDFGRNSPFYGMIRSGYWAAEDSNSSMDVDGGYFGAGIGVDIDRNFNVNLMYTTYVYFQDYYWQGNDFYYDVNRADTLMLGAEFRF